MSDNPLLALLGTPGELFEPEDERILVAALEQFALTGVRRTSTDDIARRAGVNRATLYRRMGTKDQIVGGAMVFEAGRVLSQIEEALGPVGDPADYVVRFFVVTQNALRGNRLLHQLLEVDRDETLLALTARAGQIVELASAYLGSRIRRIREHAGVDAPEPEVSAVAVVITRLTQSLLLTPDGPPELGTREQMESFARTVLVPMMIGR
ncbi:MAG: TetR family transcriptional regulator [Rhodococcus sp. (in: high G+C Gram-positive bacteria)]|uniref:TetR/AcrR family transcriptional regulator n=1 Tax=Rhodococcus sp. TaxID=1831 RepID=UPI003BAEC1F0